MTRLPANCQLNMFFMTIRFRSGSTCPATPGVRVLVAIVNDW